MKKKVSLILCLVVMVLTMAACLSLRDLRAGMAESDTEAGKTGEGSLALMRRLIWLLGII